MGARTVCGRSEFSPCNGCEACRLTVERDQARADLERGRFNCAWLVVGWCGLIEVYKHRADGFEGIESYVKLVRMMEKPMVVAEWNLTVTPEETRP